MGVLISAKNTTALIDLHVDERAGTATGRTGLCINVLSDVKATCTHNVVVNIY